MRRISMDQRNVGAQHAAPLQRMTSPTAPPLHRVLGPRIFRAVTTQLTCPSCRAEIPSGSAFCPACGTPSPTVITNERAAAAVPAAALAGVPTAQRLARALGSKYEVRRLVGRGGFAEVYELWDKDLDRRLACKVLHPEIAWTPGMLARFRQEAKALARLQHPSILSIHISGGGEGLVYYVMPFVEGESLAGALRRRGRYGTDAALAVAEPVLQALVHAHAQGLVHRDIKPDNVMLEAKTGRALLVDFGIAKLLDPGSGEGSAKTATGFTVGTVQYMSPEQALGQPNIDGRSDLYAFGAMLYQMVTGTPPYDGASSAEIVGKHLADPVPVASDVNAKIPRWLSSVIVKCLAKKPEDRYQSADEVLAALAAGRASGATGLVGARTLERQVRRSGSVRSRTARLGWRLLRPGSPPLGEPMEGALGPFTSVRGRRVARIAAAVGSQSFFAPLITNSSASDITLEVNPGTAAAARCGCLVPRGAVRAHIGYYRLYRNSVVAAYNTVHPYSGPHVDREGFAARVTPPGGAVVLEF